MHIYFFLLGLSFVFLFKMYFFYLLFWFIYLIMLLGTEELRTQYHCYCLCPLIPVSGVFFSINMGVIHILDLLTSLQTWHIKAQSGFPALKFMNAS